MHVGIQQGRCGDQGTGHHQVGGEQEMSHQVEGVGAGAGLGDWEVENSMGNRSNMRRGHHPQASDNRLTLHKLFWPIYPGCAPLLLFQA